MTFPAQTESVARPLVSIAVLRTWLARAKPRAWLEYHRGLLTLDRIKGTSSLKEAERRKLAALADHALALADLGICFRSVMARATTPTGRSPDLRLPS